MTLAAGSPTLALTGAGPADSLMASGDSLAELWGAAEASLGLLEGDGFDALGIDENGNGIYDAGDQVWLSLTPGSPSLGALRPALRM